MSNPVDVSEKVSMVRPAYNRDVSLERGRRMHPEDLMNADMLSEILLLVSASLILGTLLLILTAALTQTAALG
jgi:hypothetical protein